MKSEVFIDHLIHSIVKTKKAKKVNCVPINETIKRYRVTTLKLLIEYYRSNATINDMKVQVVCVSDIERIIEKIEKGEC